MEEESVPTASSEGAPPMMEYVDDDDDGTVGALVNAVEGGSDEEEAMDVDGDTGGRTTGCNIVPVEIDTTSDEEPMIADDDNRAQECNTSSGESAGTASGGSPSSDESDPSSDESEPPSDESEPPSDESEPPSDESEPPSDASEPSSDETEPSSDESEASSDEGDESGYSSCEDLCLTIELGEIRQKITSGAGADVNWGPMSGHCVCSRCGRCGPRVWHVAHINAHDSMGYDPPFYSVRSLFGPQEVTLEKMIIENDPAGSHRTEIVNGVWSHVIPSRSSVSLLRFRTEICKTFFS